MLDMCVGCTPGFDLTSAVDVLRLGAPYRGLVRRWIDDKTEAAPCVTGKNAFYFVARYVLGICLDMDARPRRIRGVNSENYGAGTATDGFEEVFGY